MNPNPSANDGDDGRDGKDANSTGKRRSPADALVELLQGSLDLFLSDGGQPYARVAINGHYEVHAIESAAFRDWIGREHFQKTRKVAMPAALDSALEILAGRARFEGGAPRPVHLRVAGDESAIYLDLGDPERKVVKVTADGWEVLTDSPVLFRRPSDYGELPVPVPGGSVEELREFMNLKDDDQLKLVVGFLLGALRPRPPYPILEITGSQGSAKSTTTKMLRDLIDPCKAPVRAPVTTNVISQSRPEQLDA